MNKTLTHAKSLRTNMTPAERLLWYHLRNRRFLGVKFRRQVPVGPYIADFLCHTPALVVELDGGQHVEQQSYDAQRTRYLEAQGYRVLRYWNNAVMGDVEGVMESVRLQVLALTPSPSPRGRGELPSPPAPLPEGEGSWGEKKPLSHWERGWGEGIPR